MNFPAKTLISLLIVANLAGPGAARNVPLPEAGGKPSPMSGGNVLPVDAPAAGAGIARAGGMIGMPVINALGSELGRVDDLVIAADWSIDQVVVHVGGLFGLGSRRVAVPLAEFQVTATALVLPRATDTSLATLPPFERGRFVHPINVPAAMAAAEPGSLPPGESRSDSGFGARTMSAVQTVAATARQPSAASSHLLDADLAKAWSDAGEWLGDSLRQVDEFCRVLAEEIGATLRSRYHADGSWM